jgi:hypothetical protein
MKKQHVSNNDTLLSDRLRGGGLAAVDQEENLKTALQVGKKLIELVKVANVTLFHATFLLGKGNDLSWRLGGAKLPMAQIQDKHRHLDFRTLSPLTCAPLAFFAPALLSFALFFLVLFFFFAHFLYIK